MEILEGPEDRSGRQQPSKIIHYLDLGIILHQGERDTGDNSFHRFISGIEMDLMGIFRLTDNNPETRELIVQNLYKLNILLNPKIIIRIRYYFIYITGKRTRPRTQFYNGITR